MDESEIRRRFARVREEDRARAPAFAQTYARSRSRRSGSAIHRVRPLAIAAAAAVVIAAIWLTNTRPLSHSTSAPAIARWRAPTDVLLRTPGSDVLGTMPALSESVLDKMLSLPSNRGT